LGEDGSRSRIWVRDLQTDTIASVSGGRGFAFDPSISADGRFVTWAARPTVDGRARSDRATVWLHDRTTGATTLVSRATGADGATADGASVEPAVSADGTRVVFTSTAGDLDRRKPEGLTGVFVRDLRAGRTTLLSTHAPRTIPPVGPADRARAASTSSLAPEHADMLFCALDA
jgi:Tol biopolymer transport system component